MTGMSSQARKSADNSCEHLPACETLLCTSTDAHQNADVEIARRTTGLCHLVSICRKLDRKLKWDLKAEIFPRNEQAYRLLSRARCKGYELPKV